MSLNETICCLFCVFFLSQGNEEGKLISMHFKLLKSMSRKINVWIVLFLSVITQKTIILNSIYFLYTFVHYLIKKPLQRPRCNMRFLWHQKHNFFNNRFQIKLQRHILSQTHSPLIQLLLVRHPTFTFIPSVNPDPTLKRWNNSFRFWNFLTVPVFWSQII